MPKWYMICDRVTGEAVSVGSVVADPLPDHLEARELGDQCPDMKVARWDKVTRTMVPRVVKDRLEDLRTAPEYAEFRDLWQALTAAQKLVLANTVSRLLGPYRYRQDDESVELK